MKKQSLYGLLGIFLSFFLMSPSCEKNATEEEEISSEISTDPTDEEVETSPLELLSYDYPESYSGTWGKVDSLEDLGLYTSALKVVDSIYTIAKAENNTPEIIKSVIHRMKYNSELEEDDFVLSIMELDTLSKTSTFPLKQLIHTVTAESYWQYYQNNRWRIINRTETVDFKNDDIRTWDLSKITDEIKNQYLLSLTAADSSQHTDIKDFASILHDDIESYRQRPSLYDFLAHRALMYFRNTEANVTRPADRFKIKGKAYFDTDSAFIATSTTSTDERSNHLQWFKIMQELTRFHQHDLLPEAKVDLELQRLDHAHRSSNDEEKDEWYLRALERLAKQYKGHEVYAEIQHDHAQFYKQVGTANIPAIKDPESNLIRAMDICNDAIALYPDSYGGEQCASLRLQLLQKELSFNVEEGYSPNSNGKLFIQFRNIDTLHFRKIKVPYNYFYQRSRSDEEVLKDLLRKPVLEEWTQDLRNPGDYHSHGTEILLKSKDKGQYVIIASHNKNFSLDSNAIAHTSYWTTNLSYSHRRNQNNTVDIYVTDRETGKPLKGVRGVIYTRNWSSRLDRYEWRRQESYVTDKNGSFNIKTPSDYRNIYLELVKGEDRYNNMNRIYQYRNYRDEKAYTTTTLFTDRAIYRPGQTVYFKGIQIRHDGDNHTLVKGKTSTVMFLDNNYQKIAELDLKTNEFGTYSGSFVTPSGVLNGYMRIETEDGNKYFSVEEYKRPKFDVEFKPIEGEFKIGENVEVVGQAKAYAGSSVDGAEVKYTVQRSASFSPWASYRWGYTPYSSSIQVASGEITTDENGEFSILFNAKEDKSIASKYYPNYTYTVSADITDVNGETHSAQQWVVVGYNCMNLSMTIPSSFDRMDRDKFRVNTLNLNGQKVKAKGTIEVFELKEPKTVYRKSIWTKPDIQRFTKEEYAKLFPHDEYEDESNINNFERGSKVLDKEFDTGKSDSVLFDGLKSWKPGRYVVELNSIDAFGEKVTNVYNIKITDKKSSSSSTSEIWSVVPLKTICQPGEKAQYLVSSAVKDLSVLYEIRRGNTVLKKEVIELNKSQKLIQIPIKESHRGNISISFNTVKFGRQLASNHVVTVPYSNKQLQLEFETFRNKLLPGAKEEWKIKIKGPKGEKVAAEMLATMYDASLDAFASNSIYLNVFPSYYSYDHWGTNSFSYNRSDQHSPNWNQYLSSPVRSYNRLNWWGHRNASYFNYYLHGDRNFGYNAYAWDFGGAPMGADMDIADALATTPGVGSISERSKNLEGSYSVVTGGLPAQFREVSEEENINRQSYKGDKDLSGKVQVRKNFNETAFFFPQLETNAEGEVIVKFTIPESLTEWKFLGMAHTEDLKIGYLNESVVTQKDLMILSNAPRFFREGDKMSFSAKVSNLSEEDMEGTAELMLFDALSMKRIDEQFNLTSGVVNFTAKKGQSAPLSWDIEIPEGIGAVTYRVVAKAGKYSDGEEMAVPILSNRMLVTESMPMPSKGMGTKNFTFEKLVNSEESSSLKHHKLTLEYTANPAWYTVQAMPYMMEYPYECAEQTFTRFYANSIASNIVNSSPKIKTVFEQWKSSSPDAFLSNLEKNQELKSVMLEETPWVLDAQNESERKKRVALLFDMNKMDNELSKALNKLDKMQAYNGGWPWFPGMKESRYITQHIVTGMGHLDNLGVKNIKEDRKTWNMVQDGIKYLDREILNDYNWLLTHKKDLSKQHINSIHVQYLYARSYFPEMKASPELKEAIKYYQGQAEHYWLNFGLYNQGMIALQAHRSDNSELANKVMASLKERSIKHEEFGMYWKNNTQGYYWHQAPIETHSLLIEAFDEITEDESTVEDLKVWLLKQKQTTDWKTTKATAEACYALLLRGTDLLTVDSPVEIKVNNILIDPEALGEKVEAGTGYFKTSWNPEEITPEMGNVSVTRTTPGVSWGAMYWQYFEDLDKITPHETPLKLNKKLFLVMTTEEGEKMTPVTDETKLKPGDKVRVRIELRSDRNMEYVHLKDMRAAGFEPVNVFSRYKWQDGLGYYESTKDAATNFFMDYLPKGTYVFEYDVRVSHYGDFSNGVSSIQCMYAPEFTSHSEGVRVSIAR